MIKVVLTMDEKLSNNDVELLQYYYKKRKKKIIIIVAVILAILLAVGGYIGYSIYSQVFLETKETSIKIEYGNSYDVTLENLVDTNKYPFISYENTSISSTLKNEEGKEYPAVGKYEAKLSHQGEINLFGLKKKYHNEKLIPIVVQDTTAPTITPPEKIEILLSTSLKPEEYNYLFKVSDLSETKDLVLDVSKVNVNAVGDYTITASAEDIYGNKQSVDVPCSVIEDPYGDAGTVEVETTTEAPETTTSPPQTTAAPETTTKRQSNNSSSSSNSNSSSGTQQNHTTYKSKDFLFSDGYTMSNVSDAAIEYLRASGKAGECVPLKDENGIYIGMRVTIYD